MKWLLGIVLMSVVASCSNEPEDKLPYLGRHEFVPEFKNGEMKTDTIFHKISAFKFTNQDSIEVSNATFEGKIYVSDFFFTSCPTICPVMGKNMLELSKDFENDDRVMFLSHSIDTRHDSVPVLKSYADKLSAPNNWHFVTGSKDDIFTIAEDYLAAVADDEHAPGGVVHSGHFVLIDSQGRPRAFYDGTKAENLPMIKNDIELLLKETP